MSERAKTEVKGDHSSCKKKFDDLLFRHKELENLFSAQRQRFNVLSHLTKIIAGIEHEKEQYKEKAVNFEQLYHELHRTYANLVRTRNTFGTCSYCGGSTDETKLKSEAPCNLSGRNVSMIHQSISNPTNLKDLQDSQKPGPATRSQSWTPQMDNMAKFKSKLQTDSSSCITPAFSNFQPIQSPSKLSKPVDSLLDVTPNAPLKHVSPAEVIQSKPDTQKALFSVQQTTPQAPPTAEQKLTSLPSSVPQQSNKDAEMQQHPKKMFAKLPEVSKKNFDRLAEEYTRMKHAVEKIAREKGVDMRKYLEVEEYETVVAGLREDIRYLRLQVEDLKHVNTAIVTDNMTPIVQKYQDLHAKCVKLERTTVVYKELHNNQNEVIRKLKAELDKCTQSEMTQKTIVSQVQTSSKQVEPEKEVAEVNDIELLTEQLQSLKVQLDCEKTTHCRQLQVLELEVSELRSSLALEKENKTQLNEKYMELMRSHELLLSRESKPEVTVPDSTRALIQANNEYKRMNDILNQDFKKTLEEKEVLIVQLQLFEEDFQKFKVENEIRGQRVEQLKKENEELKQFQDAKKVLNLRKENARLQEEIQRYRLLLPGKITEHPATGQRSSYGSGQSSDYGLGRSYGYGSVQSSGYGSSQSSGYGSVQSSGYGSVQSSGYGSSQSSDYGSGQSSGYGSGQSSGYGSGQSAARRIPESGEASRSLDDSGIYSGGSKISASNLSMPPRLPQDCVCKRCEMRFKANEQEKYKDHVTKCQD